MRISVFIFVIFFLLVGMVFFFFFFFFEQKIKVVPKIDLFFFFEDGVGGGKRKVLIASALAVGRRPRHIIPMKFHFCRNYQIHFCIWGRNSFILGKGLVGCGWLFHPPIKLGHTSPTV